jgi:hypothetical protein
MRDHDDPLTTPGGLAKAADSAGGRWRIWDASSLMEMLAALKMVTAQGRISLARIDQSVRRILLLKQRYRLLLYLDPQGAPVASVATASAPGVASEEPRAWRRSA